MDAFGQDDAVVAGEDDDGQIWLMQEGSGSERCRCADADGFESWRNKRCGRPVAIGRTGALLLDDPDAGDGQTLQALADGPRGYWTLRRILRDRAIMSRRPGQTGFQTDGFRVSTSRRTLLVMAYCGLDPVEISDLRSKEKACRSKKSRWGFPVAGTVAGNQRTRGKPVADGFPSSRTPMQMGDGWQATTLVPTSGSGTSRSTLIQATTALADELRADGGRMDAATDLDEQTGPGDDTGTGGEDDELMGYRTLGAVRRTVAAEAGSGR
ncbi:hypothetical protein ACLOJK_032087 [Asimina triloba]